MYLADKIAHASLPIELVMRGEKWVLPGASEFSEQVSRCVARYVLLDDVRDACCELAERWHDLLDSSNPKMRAPMEETWVEWRDPGGHEQVGILVRATRDGRAGSLRIFWTNASGVDVAQADVLFDFDQPVNFTHGRGPSVYNLWALPPVFAGLRQHLALAIDDCWAEYFRATSLGPQGLPEASSRCGKALWPDVVRGLAFFVLLASRTSLHERSVFRERLNAARAKAGKRPLLDHVMLQLGHAEAVYDGREGGTGRKHPRLHMVRGHLVRRHDSVFWRAAHVRGGVGAELPMPATRLVGMARR